MPLWCLFSVSQILSQLQQADLEWELQPSDKAIELVLMRRPAIRQPSVPLHQPVLTGAQAEAGGVRNGRVLLNVGPSKVSPKHLALLQQVGTDPNSLAALLAARPADVYNPRALALGGIIDTRESRIRRWQGFREWYQQHHNFRRSYLTRRVREGIASVYVQNAAAKLKRSVSPAKTDGTKSPEVRELDDVKTAAAIPGASEAAGWSNASSRRSSFSEASASEATTAPPPATNPKFMAVLTAATEQLMAEKKEAQQQHRQPRERTAVKELVHSAQAGAYLRNAVKTGIDKIKRFTNQLCAKIRIAGAANATGSTPNYDETVGEQISALFEEGMGVLEAKAVLERREKEKKEKQQRRDERRRRRSSLVNAPAGLTEQGEGSASAPPTSTAAASVDTPSEQPQGEAATKAAAAAADAPEAVREPKEAVAAVPTAVGAATAMSGSDAALKAEDLESSEEEEEEDFEFSKLELLPLPETKPSIDVDKGEELTPWEQDLAVDDTDLDAVARMGVLSSLGAIGNSMKTDIASTNVNMFGYDEDWEPNQQQTAVEKDWEFPVTTDSVQRSLTFSVLQQLGGVALLFQDQPLAQQVELLKERGERHLTTLLSLADAEALFGVEDPSVLKVHIHRMVEGIVVEVRLFAAPVPSLSPCPHYILHCLSLIVCCFLYKTEARPLRKDPPEVLHLSSFGNAWQRQRRTPWFASKARQCCALHSAGGLTAEPTCSTPQPAAATPCFPCR